MERVALVLGSAVGWGEEAAEACELCTSVGVGWDTFAVNDTIPVWPRKLLVAATLHAEYMPGWLKTRADNGYGPPAQVWGHRRHLSLTHIDTRELTPKGSSGLFAVRIALVRGYKSIVLCGMPMDSRPHFVRLEPNGWTGADEWWHEWQARSDELMGTVKSMSGRTRDMLGNPTAQWIMS